MDDLDTLLPDELLNFEGLDYGEPPPIDFNVLSPIEGSLESFPDDNYILSFFGNSNQNYQIQQSQSTPEIEYSISIPDESPVEITEPPKTSSFLISEPCPAVLTTTVERVVPKVQQIKSKSRDQPPKEIEVVGILSSTKSQHASTPAGTERKRKAELPEVTPITKRRGRPAKFKKVESSLIDLNSPQRPKSALRGLKSRDRSAIGDILNDKENLQNKVRVRFDDSVLTTTSTAASSSSSGSPSPTNETLVMVDDKSGGGVGSRVYLCDWCRERVIGTQSDWLKAITRHKTTLCAVRFAKVDKGYYPCKDCDQAFIQKHRLMAHKNNEHSDNPPRPTQERKRPVLVENYPNGRPKAASASAARPLNQLRRKRTSKGILPLKVTPRMRLLKQIYERR